MNYYSQYLFQSPLYEDTYIDNDIIIEYLNENFYPQEINEMYTDFLIDTFGYQILDENYYDFIVNQYGEDILVEGLLDKIAGWFKPTGGGGSAGPITKPKQRPSDGESDRVRNTRAENHKKLEEYQRAKREVGRAALLFGGGYGKGNLKTGAFNLRKKYENESPEDLWRLSKAIVGVKDLLEKRRK